MTDGTDLLELEKDLLEKEWSESMSTCTLGGAGLGANFGGGAAAALALAAL